MLPWMKSKLLTFWTILPLSKRIDQLKLRKNQSHCQERCPWNDSCFLEFLWISIWPTDITSSIFLSKFIWLSQKYLPLRVDSQYSWRGIVCQWFYRDLWKYLRDFRPIWWEFSELKSVEQKIPSRTFPSC